MNSSHEQPQMYDVVDLKTKKYIFLFLPQFTFVFYVPDHINGKFLLNFSRHNKVP